MAAACAFLLAGANFLAPSGWVEARAVTWLKAHTGYDLTVNGATRLSFRPFPHIEITDAVISARNTEPGAPELAIPKIDIDLGVLELVGDPASLTRVVIDRPVLSLHAEGRSHATPLLATNGQPKGAADAPKGLSIAELLIHDGTVLVHSARRSKPRRFERINAELSVPALTAPATGRGQLNWRGKTLRYDFALASPAIIAERGRARLELDVEADTVSAHYEGDIATVPRLAGEGTLFAKTRSVRQFFAWLKGVSGAVPLTGDGEMRSTVAWTNEEIDFSGIGFTQENARGEGNATIAFVEPRPRVEGTFVVDELNLGPALALVGRGSPPDAGATASLSLASSISSDGNGPSVDNGDRTSPTVAPSIQVEQAVVPPPSASATSEGPRLLLPGPGVSQPSLTISMPQPAIDRVLAMASASETAEPLFDADIKLDIRKAQLDGLQIGPSAVSLDFADGTLETQLWHMSFYGGGGRGSLTVAMMDPITSFSGDLRLEDVDTRSLLQDALGLDRVGGKGRLTLNISGRSGNWDSMALSLMGSGAFAISEGAVDGIAAPSLISGLEAGTLDLRPAPNAVMPFGLLAGSFDINHGLVSTHNLRLRSPSASIAADGVVNLPRASLDLVVNPGPVAKEQGGGVVSTGEHLPPLRIAGPLTNPRIGAASNPLVDGSDVSAPDLVIPGIVLRERRGIRRRNQLTGGAVPGQTQQPRALAPSFGAAPQDADGSPPLRMDSLR